MENDVRDSLEDLGYDGPLLEDSAFSDAVSNGPKSVAYTQCVEWITSQMAGLCKTEERVSAIQGPDDSESFLMELSGFLREYSCPHVDLTSGPMECRLNSREACLQLLDFLLTELASIKMIAVKKPSALSGSSAPSNEPVESDVAKHLKVMMIAIKLSKPPPNLTAFQMFSKLEAKVKELMSKCPGNLGSPLLKARLSDKQWAQIMEINAVLSDEYKIWREMLLKRLDVTIQSFKWSEKAKGKENRIAEVYQPIRTMLSSKTNVGIPQILAARDDLTRLQKTSSGEARERTKCAINKVLIGRVPDRGGRAWELEPPPPEMPSFMQRNAAPSRPQSGRGGGGRGGYNDGGRGGHGSFQDGGGRGGSGGGRGGRVQGGWGDNQQTHSFGGNWNQGGGGYRGGGGRGGGGYQGGGGGNYQGGGGGGGSYQSGGSGGGYQGGGSGYQGGGGGGYQGGGGGGYQGSGGGGRGGRGRGRGGRGGRGGY